MVMLTLCKWLLNSSEVFHLGFALQIEFVDLGNCFAIALGFF